MKNPRRRSSRFKRVAAVAIAFGVVTFAAPAAVPAQVLKELGLSDTEAQDRIHDSFVHGNLSLPGASGLRALPPARRPEVIRTTGGFAKTYLTSDQFRRRYAQDLADGIGGLKSPQPARTFADFLKQNQAEADKAVAELRKSGLQGEQLRSVEEPIRAQLKEMANVTPEQKQEWEKGDRERFEQESEDYKQALTEGRALPPNPNDLIKIRLRQFLKDTADVDYNAAVKQEGTTRLFVKPEYEGKPILWKSCYRAGKEATDAARAFAGAWLKELGG